MGSVLENLSTAAGHLESGEWKQAEHSLRQILETDPDNAEALRLSGKVAWRQGQLSEAERCLRRALNGARHSAVVYFELGTVLQLQGRREEAVACFRAALERHANHAETHNNLGMVLSDLGHFEQAVSHCRRAIELSPGFASAFCNLAMALDRSGHPSEGLAAARQAVELDPGLAEAHCNLAICLQKLGQVEEAIGVYRAALVIDPDNWQCHSNLVYLLNYPSAQDRASVFAEHRAWGQRHADPLMPADPAYAQNRLPTRRLCVAYVSAHFCSHAVNFFTEPILASHDHSAFKVICYSDVVQEDDTTRRLHGYADAWRSTVELRDEQVAELIRRDRVDILVDLAGHIAGNRLLVFARKPAPIQATYIGYQSTTGMAAMDYRISDAWADPPAETDRFYTEELVRLPRTFFCYQPSSKAPPITPVPSIANGYVTFGSFNNFTKITPEVLETWAKILAAVERSRLFLLAPQSDALTQRVHAILAQHGVEANRIEIWARQPYRKYLSRVGQVDIALDSFPFNGHTTTCDGLWMGVPVVMLAGNTYASRFGGTALVNLGLEALIADTVEQYIDIAVKLAHDRERLQHLRANLRAMMCASPMLDFKRFTRDLEAAYRQMWTKWCAKSSGPT